MTPQTAMQELIEWIGTKILLSPREIKDKATELLEKEKEQIRHSFLCGDDAAFHFNRPEDFKDFQQYWSETYPTGEVKKE